jgi:hypothetical protein
MFSRLLFSSLLLLPLIAHGQVTLEDSALTQSSCLLADPTVTVTLSGTASDDELLVGFCQRDSAQDTTQGQTAFPAGWTKITNLSWSVTAGRSRVMDAGYKLASSESGASYDFEPSINASEDCSCGILVFSGVDTTTPLDVEPTTSHRSSGEDASTDTAAITTVTDGAVVVATSGRIGDTNTRSATLTGYTVQLDADNQNQSYLVVAYKTVATKGPEDPGTFSITNERPLSDYQSQTLAIRPASADSVLFYVR